MQKKLKLGPILTLMLSGIFLSYLFFSLGNFTGPTLIIRYAFIVFFFLLTIIIIYYGVISLEKIRLFIPAVFFEIIYILNLSGYVDAQNIVNIIIQLCFFMLVFVTLSISWGKHQIRLFSVISILTILFLFILLINDTTTVNSNTIGGYAFFLLFFPLLYFIGFSKRKKYYHIVAIIAATMMIIFISGTRSIFLSIFFSLLTLFLWKTISFKKWMFNMYFLLILIFNILFIVVYPKIYLWSNFHRLNGLSLEYTGKSILSGRDKIWEVLIEFIRLKPWFGYGSGATPSDFIDTSLSAHNLYIQIGLQTGIIGIFLLMFFLFLIWSRLWPLRKDKKVILVACFFISILIHQLFEISLFQVNFGLGMIQWLIIGLGLSFCYNDSNRTIPSK